MDQQLFEKLNDVAANLSKSKNEILDRNVASISDETKRALIRETLSEALNSMMNTVTAVCVTFKVPQEDIMTRLGNVMKELTPVTIAHVREAARVNEKHKGLAAGSNSQGPVQ